MGKALPQLTGSHFLNVGKCLHVHQPGRERLLTPFRQMEAQTQRSSVPPPKVPVTRWRSKDCSLFNSLIDSTRVVGVSKLRVRHCLSISQQTGEKENILPKRALRNVPQGYNPTRIHMMSLVTKHTAKEGAGTSPSPLSLSQPCPPPLRLDARPASCVMASLSVLHRELSPGHHLHSSALTTRHFMLLVSPLLTSPLPTPNFLMEILISREILRRE